MSVGSHALLFECHCLAGGIKWILIFFGRNVTDKVGNQKALYYATSSYPGTCTSALPGKTGKRENHLSLSWIVLHTHCTCALSS